ncbi:MAG: 50S ribosomal protein L24 [Candidatus Kerfeldbacteria bacterium RIFCSPHIGHO2_02_FULL_42_14]|uniref:Large ribosomal subunit protein uL24 n=1 Tax=Candidatus Kerfeldbacteria bacterium RIFCSPHIGHO2_02_FULL_42_14 TaxID=1798540 RepID=A0A1G2ART6_9BACT|nr:MAG: 50S ribosomal protein L24 [Candidatus Kerfeldbacteria bacterium RIFCSPHIGHO2_02_FULL_42_14]OGY80417.1 MAG: 50S ribosomal protein L24 [Candidatus Kerfeldbacteria bacterium RIFCSPHIGHO2_12_FULL_42_13]OGY83847.1 MAG: 50S ribosomal protein L24 [Candidatus Kerfeldbacteria bacterium RIFCSPLOWO2_02_FULL_42_19]OGY85308.1 MAG: 50S ribosomal protein L24 [Candidatus Kerfeldbacteria bacterium RIFCSPLOWO2_12_FULL_43_9]
MLYVKKTKIGDRVKVLSGKDRGKIGKVTQIFHNEQKIVVEGVNKMIKHLRSKRKEEKGQRIEFFAPLAVSNVAPICPHCNKTTRPKFEMQGDTKVRVCRRCKLTLTEKKE